MVTTVEYTHQFAYAHTEKEGVCPVITVSMCPPELLPDDGIEVDAFLDSGTSTSLFNGSFLRGFDIDVINDRSKTFTSTAGVPLAAYLHRVKIMLPSLGTFDLDIGFSIDPIRRNLLGRDFFNLVQIGFRENQLQYYLKATP